MEEYATNWTKEELKIYFLIYCSKADFFESKVETDFIKSKTDVNSFERIHKEFDEDNDYQSIQKIQFAIEKFGYSQYDISLLLEEIKQLFLSDGKYGILEQNLYMGLNHIFN